MENHNHKNRACSGRRLARITDSLLGRLSFSGVLYPGVQDIAQRSARAAFVKGISDVDWLGDAWRIFIEDYEGASQ
jgi:hypothetical protein